MDLKNQLDPSRYSCVFWLCFAFCLRKSTSWSGFAHRLAPNLMGILGWGIGIRIHIYASYISLVGGWPTPLKHMKVSWDYYSQLNGKIKHVPNHQSDQPSSCAPSWHSFRPSDSAWARTSFKAFLGDRTVAQPCKKPWVFYRHKCARCMQQTLVGGLNHLDRYESQWEGLSWIIWLMAG